MKVPGGTISLKISTLKALHSGKESRRQNFVKIVFVYSPVFVDDDWNQTSDVPSIFPLISQPFNFQQDGLKDFYDVLSHFLYTVCFNLYVSRTFVQFSVRLT